MFIQTVISTERSEWRNFFCIINIAISCLLLALSCQKGPVPSADWMPVFVSTEAQVHGNSAVLTAALESGLSEGFEYGFYYGTPGAVQKNVTARFQDSHMVAEVSSLEYDCSYVFKAYISNGRNEMCSQENGFVTYPRPQTPSQPVEPETPEPDGPAGPDEPDIPVTPDEPEIPDVPVVPEPDVPVEPDGSEEIIVFADELVRSACVEALDDNSDGEVSLREAAAVTDLSAIALKGKPISSFDEFRYFTSVRTVPFEYFKNSYLESIKLPSSLEIIGESSFAYCICLTEMEIPASVKKIEKFAFCYCSNLRRVTLPDTLGDIAEQAFRSCYALREINIPQSITELSDWLFYQCRSLASVSLSENLCYIRRGVFEDCDALTEVTVPSRVKVIGDNAFSDCGSLERVNMRPLNPPVLGLTPFNDNHPDRIIYVPSSALEVYKEEWGQYENLFAF